MKLFYKKENQKLKKLIQTKEKDMQVFESGLFIRDGKDEFAVSLSGDFIVFRVAFDQTKFNKWDSYTEVVSDKSEGIQILVKGVEFPSGIDTSVIREAKERFKEMLCARTAV